jgi:hypothetical protein
MVMKFTKNGFVFHEPPYTKAEDEFYRRQGPPVAMYYGRTRQKSPAPQQPPKAPVPQQPRVKRDQPR